MGKRILVVDDEKVVLGAVIKALKKSDYQIETAESAESALNQIDEVTYDVVITDLMMPGIDGLELMEHLRKKGTDTRVIVITGYPSVDSALEAKRLGAFEYVTKPFTRQELLSVVVRALRHGEEVATRGDSTSTISTGKIYMIPDHAWVQLEPDRTARIGMAPAFASTVGEVADIELPVEDQLLEQGRMCVVVRAEDGVEHYLQSPLSGRVLEINRMVGEEPELVVRDPEDSGWLIRLEPQAVEKELPNLVEKE